MRIFISTGEVSGDMHGAMLIEALQRHTEIQKLELEIFALGGDRMEKAGARLLGNTTTISAIGLLESVPYILPTLQVQKQAKKYLRNNPPDVLIFIDYIGPNVAIGNFARKYLPHTPIVYYIAPQDWVWSPSPKNTRQLVKIIDKLLAIFPQEAKYFTEKGVDVSWIGHPLVDRLQNAPNRSMARSVLNIAENKKIITLLPASRQQELKYLLPLMFQAAKQIQDELPEVEFLIPISLETYRKTIDAAIIKYNLNARSILDRTVEAIAAADLAITKSGTVNLEIALLNVPQVVFYKVNPVTAWIAQKLLNFSVPFISPVNLMVMREIVPELLQTEATVIRIARESLTLMVDTDKRTRICADYQEMRRVLGEFGALDRAAKEIIKIATKTKK
jgi:lipid-A-disaccharide synthase